MMSNALKDNKKSYGPRTSDLSSLDCHVYSSTIPPNDKSVSAYETKHICVHVCTSHRYITPFPALYIRCPFKELMCKSLSSKLVN